MPSWQATCFSSAWWGGSGGFTYLVSNCGDDSEGKARRGRTVRAALGGVPPSLRGDREACVAKRPHRYRDRGASSPRPSAAIWFKWKGKLVHSCTACIFYQNDGISRKKRASFLRAVPSAVPFQGLIDGGTKHVVVGIPPPPSRCPIHPTLSFPLLYLPPNNPKSPLTRFLLPI